MKKLLLALGLLAASCAAAPQYDVVIRHGTVYDGTGVPGAVQDLAIQGDRIAARGDLSGAHGREDVDATGLAVAPGFIDMLNHAETSLIADGRSQSGIRQGVTLSVFGESSMGPLTDAMKQQMKARQADIKFDITWTTLGEYLDSLVARGVSTNVASFVSASTVRANVIGLDNRAPTAEELDRMRTHVRLAMSEGAMGVTTALIYTPAVFAGTDELIELSKVAAKHGGLYIAHMRSEGDRFLEAIDETLRIAREAQIPVEIYHLKAGGESNWPKMKDAIAKIDAARAAGLQVTADMYNYTAGATGFDAAMPPWVQEGGVKAWIARLQDPAIRARVISEMRQPGKDWENLYRATGSPERVLLLGFKTDALKPLTGKTLAEVARTRGTSPEDTIIDLVIADGTRVEVAYFLMSEDNIKLQIAQPWMSFGSDEGSSAPEGVFLKSNPHPRAYGNFARLLGHYVRDEQVISLTEAVRRLTLLPATNLHLDRRGALRQGYFADVAIFDPATIADHATYDAPRQYATGMKYVIVNGVTVLRDGEHTGALPGRVVLGPGAKPLH